MHCNEARQQLDALNWIHEIPDDELLHHLQECDACHEYARERQLVGLLASLPVREPRPGMEERVLQKALGRSRPSAAGLHARWALATAASVVLAVLVTLQFYPAGTPREPVDRIQPAVVQVQPQQTRMVNVLLTSARPLSEALITVQLDENLELEGYRGVHNLQWRTPLKSGNNQLSLPVQLLRGQSGNLTVTVEHGGSSKRFSVRINAAPDNGGQTLSMV